MLQLCHNKGGIGHLITSITKSTICAVAKFVPEACVFVILANTAHLFMHSCVLNKLAKFSKKIFVHF